MPMIDIQQNATLAPFTTFGIGGPARYLARVKSLPELREALLFARGRRLPFGILGGGSNLLVSDAGFEGVAIRLELEEVLVSGDQLTAQAGVDLNALVLQMAELGLGGLEPLAGIPGLVGGAIRGNAGAYGSCIGELTASVRALQAETLELLEINREECCFDYRSSRFKKDPRLIVVSARLALSPGDPAEIRRKAEETIAKRTARHLHCEKSVGSFFMNPLVTDQSLVRRFETEQKVRCRNSRIPAGWLIDQAGLRNTRVGAAMVSALHANYLVNTGDASAAEVLALAQLIKSRVHAATGVQLQEEASCLGFPPRESCNTPAAEPPKN